MARARIELRGSLSHTVRGRVFKKGQPQIITSPDDILYFQQTDGFVVTLLNAAEKVKAPEMETQPDADDEPVVPPPAPSPAAPTLKLKKKPGFKTV
jgi:hypothetical protein